MSIGRGLRWAALYRGDENVAREEKMCYPYVGVDGLGYYRRRGIGLLVWKGGGEMRWGTGVCITACARAGSRGR